MNYLTKPIYLFIVPYFPTATRHWGSYLYDQVKAVMATNQYQVEVLYPSSNGNYGEDYEFGGIKVRRFKTYNFPSSVWDGAFDFFNLCNFEKRLKELNIDINDIKIVHAHIIRQGIYANHLKRKNPKIITILQHHGYDVLAVGDGRFAKYKWHKKHAEEYGIKICNEIDLHVGVSQATLDALKKYPVKIKESYVLYNGIDYNKFHPLEKKDIKVNNTFENDENHPFIVGCIANFWEIKDHITLIKAVEILINQYNFDIKLILVGTGFTLVECKNYVKEKKLEHNIIFHDHIPHDQLIYFYNSLDLFVLPSYWDTLGCVYLEAYACGVSFITSEGSGIIELIDEKDKEKWVAPKSAPQELALRIKEYYEKPSSLRLKQNIDINFLIPNFLNKLNTLKCKQ